MPPYDFTYCDGPNGWQTLSVAGEGENPTQADLDRLAKEVGLRGGIYPCLLCHIGHCAGGLLCGIIFTKLPFGKLRFGKF